MPGLYFDSGIDKGFEKDLLRMNSKMDSFKNNVAKKGDGINKVFGTIAKSVGGIVSVMAIAAAGKEMLNFSKALETSLIEVATISSDVTENFEEYKKILIQLSKREDLAASSAKDLADAYYDIVSAGYDGAEGLKILEVSARAGTAGFVEAGIAADGVTTVLNAWGKSADEAANVSDIFFKTVEKGKTTFPELGQNIAKVAPLAASMGISFEEVSAAIASVTKQGTRTPEALTQLRAAMVSMNKVLGDGWSSTMTFQEGLQAISDKAGGSQNALKELLGTDEAVLAVLALTGKNAKEASKDLDAMNNSLGATAEAAEKVTTTSAHQIKTLKNNILASMEGMSSGVLSAFGKASESINRMFSKASIKNIEDQRKQFGLLITSLNDSTKSEKERLSILKRLKEIAPGIEKDIKKEGDAYVITTAKLVEYNQQFINRLVLAEKEFEIETFRRKAAEAGAKAEQALVTIQTKRAQAIFAIAQKNTQDSKLVQGLLDGTINKETKLSEVREKFGEANAVLLNKSGINTSRNNKEFVNAQNIAIRLIAQRNGFTSDQIGLDQEFYDLVRQFNPLFNEQNRAHLTANSLQAESVKLAAALGIELGKNKDKLNVNIDVIDPVEELKKAQTKAAAEAEKLRIEQLRLLEISNQETINEIARNYGNRELLEVEFNQRMIDNQLDYLDQKRKLTISELEKLLIDQEIINKRYESQGKLQKLTPYTPTINRELRGVSQTVNEDGISKQNDIVDSLNAITDAFSGTGNEITNQLVDLSSSTINAFETLNTESSTTSDKISGVISLIMAAGNIIKDIVSNSYTKESAEQGNINSQLADRISAESTINRLMRERQEIELESSAFLEANYKDRYNLALQTLSDSQNVIDKSLYSLSNNLVLTATGNGESWLGINKTAEEYSFTLSQILDKTDTLSGVSTGSIISNILDPADIFGGAASGEAYEDAFNKVADAFNSTLSSMGKTAADMANFSQEEWVDFYTILDEGGYVLDQGTKKLVSALRDAQEQYSEALEEMKGIISSIAGELGNALGDSIINAIELGSDALGEFEKSLNKVFIEMAKAEMNKFFFQSMFDQLQKEMELSMDGGDGIWKDDLLRFYEKLPPAIEGAKDFMEQIDAQLQDIGLDGISGDSEAARELSTAGQIRQSITEDTGTILAGHIGAVRLSNERISNYSENILDLAVRNLVVMNQIKVNTDYLPEIAANTKKTYQKLGGI